MATYDLEEQEQLDELKTWWKQYGNLVTGILFVLALAVAGWQGWNWWQRKQAVEASVVFSSLQEAAGLRDAKRARELAGELIDKYSGTAYAGMGALVAARVQVDAQDVKNARVQLAWAAEKAEDPALRDLARLRLAALMLDDKAHEEAIKQLAAAPLPSFAARFAELRGDILAAQGKPAEARKAYEEAIAGVAAPREGEPDNRAAYREMLAAKRDSQGAAK